MRIVFNLGKPMIHSHGFKGNWPFDEAQNLAVMTTRHVLSGRFPILLATHDADDGGWQLLCGTTNDESEARIECLGCLVERDPSLGELATLPLGWRAWRETVESGWQFAPI